MGIIGGELGYRLLRKISTNGENSHLDGSAYANVSKLEKLLGKEIWKTIKGKVVIDFGCGDGIDAVEVAERGAQKVIGLDIRDHVLARAARRAAERGVGERCSFVKSTDEKADIILSIDSFEHFECPDAVLKTMRNLLKDNGQIVTAFGPIWYHPLGGHLFSVFPWAHLIFTEKALIRWRSDFKTDGATRFEEAEGGLNKMTISRFLKIVAESDFAIEEFEAVPIRKLHHISNRLTREFTTAIVRCKLIPRSSNSSPHLVGH